MNATRITHAIIFGEVPKGTRLKYSQRIPVRNTSYFAEQVTVQSGYYENGEFIVESCNHAGAELEAFDSMEFDSDSANFAPTGTLMAPTCDKKNCQAVYNPLDGKWETR